MAPGRTPSAFLSVDWTAVAQRARAEAGSCRLIAPIGRGAYAEVWRGFDAKRSVDAALKFVLPEAANQFEAEQVRREASLLSALRHPGVVEIFEEGEVSPELARATGNRLCAGTPFFSMELLAGGTLLRHVRRPTPWPGLEALLLKLLQALTHIHAASVVHGDLTPSNVLCRLRAQHSEPVLVDFGSAISLDAPGASPALLREGSYRAPEQRLNQQERIGAWTDLYALGVMAWEWLTGELPCAESQHTESALTRPAALKARVPVPPELDAWLARLLHPRIDRRFRAADEAMLALRALFPAQSDVGCHEVAYTPERELARALATDAAPSSTVSSARDMSSLPATLAARELPALQAVSECLRSRDAHGALALLSASSARDEGAHAIRSRLLAARALRMLGELQAAAIKAQEAHERARAGSDPFLRAEAARERARVASERDERASALRWLLEAEAHARRANHAELVARCQLDQAVVLERQGLFAEAGQRAEQAAERFQADSLTRAQATCAWVLGRIARRSGDLQLSEMHLCSALRVLEADARRAPVAEVLGELARLCRDRGDLPGAAAYFERALTAEVALGSSAFVPYELGLGVVRLALDQFELARDLVEGALHSLHRSHGPDWAEAYGVVVLPLAADAEAWDAWDAWYEPARAALLRLPQLCDEELLHAADKASSMAATHGDPVRASRVAELACEQRRRLRGPRIPR